LAKNLPCVLSLKIFLKYHSLPIVTFGFVEAGEIAGIPCD
jgi:hypothetical protein